MILPFEVAKLVRELHQTGSRYICDPPPEGTDEDWALLVTDLEAFRSAISVEVGFHLTSLGQHERYPDGWHTYRAVEGPENLIVTADEAAYGRWVLATLIAKRLNLREKADRIFLFQILVDGKVKNPMPHENDIQDFMAARVKRDESGTPKPVEAPKAPEPQPDPVKGMGHSSEGEGRVDRYSEK